LVSEKAAKVPIRIREDFASGRGALVNLRDQGGTTWHEISPDGAHALLSARGDVFTVRAKDGVARNLTKSPGVYEHDPKWAPDGKHIAYISDVSGEEEIHLLAPDGGGAGVQLTSTGGSSKFTLSWSPDSAKIAWLEGSGRLLFLDVATRVVKQA